MWITKKIALLDMPVGPLLTRESLAEHQQALSLLQTAEQQAQQRVARAEAEAEQLLQEAKARAEAVIADRQQAFIAQTAQFFANWQQQQQHWQDALIPQAEALLKQAMSQLLADFPPDSRLSAMLRQLQQAQGRQAAATLSCAPVHQKDVDAWLKQQPLDWQLVSDASLDDDTLRLTTDSGELSLSWSQVCTALMPV